MRFEARLLKCAEDQPQGDVDKLYAYLIRMGDQLCNWVKDLLPDSKVKKSIGPDSSGWEVRKGVYILVDGVSRFVLSIAPRNQDQGYPCILGHYYDRNQAPIDPEVVEDMFLGSGFRKTPNGYVFTIGSYLLSENTKVLDELLREVKGAFDRGESDYYSLATLLREFEPYVKGPDGEQLRHYVFQALKQIGERSQWIGIRREVEIEDRPSSFDSKAIFGIGDKGTMSIYIPSFLFFLSKRGMFNPKDQAEILRIAKSVMNKILRIVKDNPEKLFNLVGFYTLMDMDPALYDKGIKLLRKIIGEKYQYLNSYETTKMINTEPDPYKRKEMMEYLTKELEKVLGQMESLGNGKTW